MIHNHKCYRCECVWQHNSDDFVFGTSQLMINFGHTCPNCGSRGQWCWLQYFGNSPPLYFNHHWSVGYKIPFYSRYDPLSNRNALYRHLYTVHFWESRLMQGLTHRELSGLHSHIHADLAVQQMRVTIHP